MFGPDLGEIEALSRQVEAVVKAVPGTSSAYAERVIGGYYLDIVPDRVELGRYGLVIGDVQDVIASALGGESVTSTVEGRERYSVNIRYPRDLRSSPEAIATEVLVPLPKGGFVPLGAVAEVKLMRGATSIRTENGQLAVYIFVDMAGRDLGGYVAEAREAVAKEVTFPPGTYIQWSGQFEYLERAEARLKIVVPLTLMIIFLLLYLNFRRLTETLIVMLSTNAINTQTRGLDLVTSYKASLNPQNALTIFLTGNYNHNEVVSLNEIPTALAGQEDVYYGPQERSLIETNTPRLKGSLQLSWDHAKWNILLRNTYFGEVTRNGFPFGTEQTHSAKVVTDLTVSYQLPQNVTLTAGANNLFNVFPDEQVYENSYFGVFKYAPVQMGTTGAYYFARLTYGLGK